MCLCLQPIVARATDTDLKRFVGEVAALSTLRHPNIVQFLGAVWQVRERESLKLRAARVTTPLTRNHHPLTCNHTSHV